MATTTITDLRQTVGDVTTHAKPEYKIAKTITDLDLLHFNQNYLKVRPILYGKKVLGYEQLVQERHTDFMKFDGDPDKFRFGVGFDGHDKRLYFTSESTGPWEPSRPVLVVEGWQSMGEDAAEAYKAVLAIEKQQRAIKKTAEKLEKQARALRRG